MKPTIKPIEVDKQKMEYLDRVLKSNLGANQKKLLQRKITGDCSICGNIPTKVLTYDMDGASLIQKYCDKHVPK